jgi:outer membrane receptor protein involved in Fe transport
MSPGLILDSGARIEWFTPGKDAESMPHADPIRDSWTVSPRLGMVFPLSLHNAVQVSYVRISQPPGRDYLYDSRTARIDPRSPQGNPNLLPSTAISYELSLKHRRDERWTGRVSLFYRDLFRQISARTTSTITGTGPDPRTFVLHYASDDAARAQGIELMVGRDDPGRSGLAVTYTWMQTEGSESFEDGVPYYPLTLPQPPAAVEHPLAWDQRHRLTLAGTWSGRHGTAAWTTVLGSGLPWTPAVRREVPADLSLVHSERLGWSALSDLTLRTHAPGGLRHASVGIEVRNVFDFRGARRVSEDGFPNRFINTAYDDYAAYRTETHQGGAAYWNDSDGDGLPGWTRVSDPRLDYAPRTVRMIVETDW